MIGAIIGDIVGSIFERHNIKTTDFNLFNPGSTFTDDTVLSVAVAEALLTNTGFAENLKKWGRKYPFAGYGQSFSNWLHSSTIQPYNSWGNGSAMRVSPVGFAAKNLDEALEKAKNSAAVTHNHPEGIKGAQAVAVAVFMAKKDNSKEAIKTYLEQEFKYDLSRKIAEIRPGYTFDVSCQGSVPEAIIAFLESSDYENCIRLAVSLGGDSDTIACISGGIAQAYYKEIPPKLVSKAKQILPAEMLKIIDDFEQKYLQD